MNKEDLALKRREVMIEEVKMMDYAIFIVYYVSKLDVRGRVKLDPETFSEENMLEAIKEDLEFQMPALKLLEDLKAKYEGQQIHLE